MLVGVFLFQLSYKAYLKTESKDCSKRNVREAVTTPMFYSPLLNYKILL